MLSMVKGKWYRVVYRRYGGRVNDVMVGQYLGVQGDESHAFSLRPLAGTCSLAHAQLVNVQVVAEAKAQLPQRARGE